MSDTEDITMTTDASCKGLRLEKLLEGDLSGWIVGFKGPLKVVEAMVEIIEREEIEDGYLLVGLFLGEVLNDVLSDTGARPNN